MWPIFEQSVTRFHELEQQLSDPAVTSDRARFAKVAKEHGALAKQVKPYLEYKQILADLKQAEDLATNEADAEMRELAQQEIATLTERRDALQTRLEDFLLAEGEDFDKVIVEI